MTAKLHGVAITQYSAGNSLIVETIHSYIFFDKEEAKNCMSGGYSLSWIVLGLCITINNNNNNREIFTCILY
jgi:hypothetical protein